jgi:hydroxypyruvate reductase
MLSLRSPALARHPDHERIEKILRAALRAADPESAVRGALRLEKETLLLDGKDFPLPSDSRLAVLAIGKAAIPMAAAARDILGNRISEGLVVSKDVPARDLSPLRFILAGHPIPDEGSLRAGRESLRLARGLGKNDILLLLLSGGGSALAAAPLVPLSAMQTLTDTLLASGADIEDINTLRRHLDALKGGGLARAAYPARVLTLVLSDVIGSPIEAIASGPAAPDPTSLADARQILEKYALREKIPPIIFETLRRVEETPKPGARIFETGDTRILCDNEKALHAAKAVAKAEGIFAPIVTTRLRGEASRAGRALATLLRQPLPQPACLLAGGETTVTLGETRGRGGRTLELALAAVPILAGVPGAALLSFATDGEDGNSGAAGAFVTEETFRLAASKGMRPDEFLQKHDSFSFFDALGAALVPGRTGTNVNDVVLLWRR